MVIQTQKKRYLIGYRSAGVDTYRTQIKPLGYLVAGLGFACLGVAVFPNGLGIVFYPLGFALLGLVGIETVKYEKKFKDKLRFALWRFSLW